jgi:hypothetical protein
MKAFTDLEQSNELTEILSIDSADHHYVRKVTDFMGNPVNGEWSHPKYGNPNSKYANYIVQNFSSYETIPCWSLTALLSVIPQEIFDGEYVINITEGSDNRWVLTYDCYWNRNHSYAVSSDADNLVDACVIMIEKLYKRKML